MKNIALFLIILMFSSIALADGGIPLLLFFGSNLFITGTPMFGLGLLLFWIVYKIEKDYLIKRFGKPEKFKKAVFIANIYSTLWGIPLTIALTIFQIILPQHCWSDRCDPSIGLVGPAYNLLGWLPTPIATISGVLLYLIIFIWESWFVEYRYLNKKLNLSGLKKQVLIANIYSYIGMMVLIGFFPLAIFIAHFFMGF